jgi:hypothetical protein
MAERIGRITDVKLATFFPGSPTAVDTCMVTLEDANAATTIFLLWVSRPSTSTYARILETQRLALVREAAFRRLTVHLFHESGSSIVDQIKVDIP